jgi:prepilin-type N-terminal cleavage/methylation domain-containing protein/prepilin-type processing-associated H-X9-DG protein
MNKYKKGFTLIELLVVIAIIAVLMAILMPALNRVKEQGKRIVCENSLKSLQLCWIMYADDNDSKIVNGEGGYDYSSGNLTEIAWVGQAWKDDYGNPRAVMTLTDSQLKQEIEDGALWEYVKDYDVYKCPTGRSGEWVTYAVVDAPNGRPRTGTWTGGNHVTGRGERNGRTVLWFKTRAEITTPGPAERMVFIDEGAMTPDSFAVHYAQRGPWWDDPPVRHGDGTTVTWADGHVSHLKWKAAETIKRARDTRDYYGGGGWMPQTPEGIEELEEFQKAVWGKVGY